jgi:hypothetical protein
MKTAVGAAIVLFAIREMFHDLFHPSRSGALSDWVASGTFRFFRRWPRMLPTAGPLALSLSISLWVMLLVVGFALIYWAVFPAAYQFQSPPPPGGWAGWWWSFYYSLEMLTTLGLGDIQALPTWLKVLSACHTLIGFSLITASITWIVLVFPALGRIRTLARKAITLNDAELSTGVPVVSAGMHVVVAGLAEQTIQCRVDLVHFPILFYFAADDARASLPHALFALMRFAGEGEGAGRDDLVRLSAAGLRTALGDLADLIADRLECRDRSPGAVFKAFRELHTPRNARR